MTPAHAVTPLVVPHEAFDEITICDHPSASCCQGCCAIWSHLEPRNPRHPTSQCATDPTGCKICQPDGCTPRHYDAAFPHHRAMLAARLAREARRNEAVPHA